MTATATKSPSAGPRSCRRLTPRSGCALGSAKAGIARKRQTGRVKSVNLLEVASDDVVRWFGACETKAECRQLALDMKKIIDSVAAIQEGAVEGREDGGRR